MPIKDYRKYYWVDDHFLEREVRSAFVQNHFLTAEQFFEIVFWKSRRPAKRIRAGLSDKAVKDLTSAIYIEKDLDAKLDILLDKDGIDIAMASAILTVLYPDVFSIYDYRVREQLNKRIPDEREQIRKLITVLNRKEKKRLYWKYVSLVKSTYPDYSLRDCDRALWGESWYKDLHKFLHEGSGIELSEQ